MPGTAHRDVVEARLQNLTRRLKKQQENSRMLIAAPRPAEPVAAPAPAPPDLDAQRSERWKKTAGWTAVGLGGAAILTGVIFGALAEQKEGEYQDGVKEKQIYYEQLQVEEAGRRYQTVSIASLVAGSVLAAAGGGILLWNTLGRREKKPDSVEAAFAPFATGTGAGITGRVRF